MLDHTLITAFIVACLGLLVLICGFFVKTWIENLGGTITKLSDTVEELTSVVHEVKQEQALMRLRNKQLTMEMRDLQASACVREDCPAKETNPGTHRFIPRTRITDLLPELTDESGEFEALND